MYRVVICDDELDARNRLISLIKKTNDDYEIVAVHENGLDASEGILNDKADIMLVDIKMPYVDGISLIEQVKRLSPLTQIIIVSGYDEFDYAKKAIDLGVIGYVTKPITLDILSTVLDKAKEALNSEYLSQNNLFQLEELRVKTKNLFKENDLKLLFNMNTVTNQFMERFKHNGINLNYKYVAIAYFDYDKPIHDLRYNDYEVTQLGIIKAVEEVFNCYEYDCFTKNDRIALLIKSDKPIVLQTISNTLAVIVNKVNRFSTEQISVGVSEVSVDIHHYKDLFKNAKKTLEAKSLLGQERVHIYDEVYNNNLPEYIDEEMFTDFNYAIMYLSKEDILDRLNKIKEKISSTNNINNQYYIMTKLLNNIVKYCDNSEILFNTYMNYNDLYRNIFENKSIENLFSKLETLSFKVKEINDSIKIKAMNNNFEKILDYIKKNYKKSDISLESLSEEVNYSISYISALFKKEMNTTFIKYLTSLKMEEAKRLLSMPNVKIVNVANELGFSEPYYFSHCFKKYFGVSPKEFKNNEQKTTILNK